jgi:hypothetical protein
MTQSLVTNDHCAQCGAAVHGRFCELCGHDSSSCAGCAAELHGRFCIACGRDNDSALSTGPAVHEETKSASAPAAVASSGELTLDADHVEAAKDAPPSAVTTAAGDLTATASESDRQETAMTAIAARSNDPADDVSTPVDRAGIVSQAADAPVPKESGTTAYPRQPNLVVPASPRMPPLVGVVIGLQVLLGIYLIVEALRPLPDTFRLLTLDGFPKTFALVVLVLLVIVAALGLALLALARMLHRADRIGRGLTYVACGTIASSILLGQDHRSGMMLAALGCVAAIISLALVPEVDNYFTGPQAPLAGVPTGVVVSQTILTVWVATVSLVSVLYFLLGVGGAGVQWVLLALVLGAMAFGVRRAGTELQDGNPAGRGVITIVMGVTVLLVLIGRDDTGMLVPLGLSVGAIAGLWLPQDSRRFFAPGTPIHA